MSEQEERGGEPQVENKMTEAEVLQKIREVTGRNDLEICPETVLLNKQGKVKSLGTKTIWNETPDENGVYHGVAFWYDPASGKDGRLHFKEFNNIIFRVDWTGVKKGGRLRKTRKRAKKLSPTGNLF